MIPTLWKNMYICIEKDTEDCTHRDREIQRNRDRETGFSG